MIEHHYPITVLFSTTFIFFIILFIPLFFYKKYTDKHKVNFQEDYDRRNWLISIYYPQKNSVIEKNYEEIKNDIENIKSKYSYDDSNLDNYNKTKKIQQYKIFFLWNYGTIDNIYNKNQRKLVAWIMLHYPLTWIKPLEAEKILLRNNWNIESSINEIEEKYWDVYYQITKINSGKYSAIPKYVTHKIRNNNFIDYMIEQRNNIKKLFPYFYQYYNTKLEYSKMEDFYLLIIFWWPVLPALLLIIYYYDLL